MLLRVSVLVAGATFLGWRALAAWRAAPGLEPGMGLLQARMAVVEGLVALLALLTAVAAALSLRARRRRGSLKLGEPVPRRRAPDQP